MKTRKFFTSFSKYATIWWKFTAATSQQAFASRFGAIIFILGKLLRFVFFLIFLLLLVSKTNAIAGYSLWQVILFYATFNLVDTLPQFFLREVYRFRWQVISGAFDFVLTKPISPLFRTLLGGSDMFDLSILILSIVFILVSIFHLQSVSIIGILLYGALIINAFLIALSFHICVVALGILTTEVDNTIMLYRDITQMGRFPVDMYREPVKGLITFVIPVGIMMTFPAKALMGLLSWQFTFLSVIIAITLLHFSYRFWQYALRNYASASS